MTLAEVTAFCEAHTGMKCSRTSYYSMNTEITIYTFENGDIYEYHQTELDYYGNKIHVKHRINGETVYAGNMEFYNFGWRETA